MHLAWSYNTGKRRISLQTRTAALRGFNSSIQLFPVDDTVVRAPVYEIIRQHASEWSYRRRYRVMRLRFRRCRAWLCGKVYVRLSGITPLYVFDLFRLLRQCFRIRTTAIWVSCGLSREKPVSYCPCECWACFTIQHFEYAPFPVISSPPGYFRRLRRSAIFSPFVGISRDIAPLYAVCYENDFLHTRNNYSE